MPPGLRKAVLATHLTAAVGWIGAVAAYLAMDIVASTSADPPSLRAAYFAMGTVASWVIVPLAVAALVSGVAVSVGTKWGLFRHWWVLISLLLTAGATAVLLVESVTISALASIAADPATSAGELRSLGGTLVHSAGGLAVLLVIAWLNVYKPHGLTRYGWRRQQAERLAARARADGATTPEGEA